MKQCLFRSLVRTSSDSKKRFSILKCFSYARRLALGQVQRYEWKVRMYLNCKYSGKKIFFHSCVYVFELKMTSAIFLWVSKPNQALQFCLVNGKHLEIDEPLPNFVWVWILRPCSSVSLIQFCNGKVSIQSFFFLRCLTNVPKITQEWQKLLNIFV